MALRRPRRALAVAGAAALLSTALLSGCGFNQATDRPLTPAWGANDQSSDAYVLGAAVVAPEDGTGVFIASLSNETQDRTISLTDITGNGVQVQLDHPVEIAPRSLVNLADEDGVPVTGDFTLDASEFVTLTLQFDGADAVEIEVPVIPATGDFADVGGHGASGEASPSESAH